MKTKSIFSKFINIGSLLPILLLVLVSCSKSEMYKQGDNLTVTEQTVGTTTEEGFDKMLQISNAKDGEAFSNMVLLGEMYIIESGVKAKVLETKIGKVKCKVAIENIEHDLWINTKFLK